MQLLAFLEKVKSTGMDKWTALCPCHDEKTPSLNIKIASNGNIIMHCFGCGANGVDVYRKLGLNLSELFGGKELESTYIPQEITDNYDIDKVVIIIYDSDKQKGKYISLQDNRRHKLAVARIAGIEKKFPHIKDRYC